MNLSRGFQRITLILAILAGLICGTFAGSIPVKKYCKAQVDSRLVLLLDEPSDQELREFIKWQEEEGITISHDLYQFCKEPVGQSLGMWSMREGLVEMQKEKFWRDLSKPQLVAYCILTGAGCGAAVFLSTWLIIWFGGLSVYKLAAWLACGFKDAECPKA